LKTILHDELHWLNVPERTGYELGVMVYPCLHDRAPQYLADHLIPASDAAPRRLRLRSANLNRLSVPGCRLSMQQLALTAVGLLVSRHAGPTVWNSLPDELRNSDSFDGFKRFFKFFSAATSRFCNEMHYKSTFYLLTYFLADEKRNNLPAAIKLILITLI